MIGPIVFHLAIFLFALVDIQAQELAPFYPRYDIPIQIEGQELEQATVGGFDNPQFSQIDWNQDGWSDLYVFDKSGNSSMAFVWNPATEQFESEAQYLKNFPRVFDWALMKDFTDDGLPDIFTYYIGGCRVFVSSIVDGEWRFTKMIDKLRFDGNKVLGITRVDIPAFEDVDFDGDLDILTFEIIGNFMDYYENMAFDDLGRTDTLLLVNSNDCWGDFKEAEGDNSVLLGIGCDGKAPTSEHAGSTTLALDADSDGDTDLLIGDIFSPNLNLLINGGTAQDALITEQDPNFPSNGIGVDVLNFPAAYLADFSQDGTPDLLLAPNDRQLMYNRNNIWAYERNGNNFNLVQTDFLGKKMLDVGTNAFPYLLDYNQDGLLDLLIGRQALLVPPDTIGTASISLYENVGSITEPIFEWITDDFQSLSQYGLTGCFPAFADLDKDGDVDMIAGEKNGRLHYFKNVGTSQMQLTLEVFNFLEISKYAAPHFFDVNADGNLDLIVGDETGRLGYYENTSTTDSIAFTLVDNFWGTVDVRDTILPVGYSVPLMFEDQLLVYALDGTIRQYSNWQDSIFTLETMHLSNIRQSGQAGLTAGDLDGDGFEELIVGNARGGIHIYSQNPLYNGILEVSSPLEKRAVLDIYPNPANDVLMVNFEGNFEIDHFQEISSNDKIKFYDTIGHCWELEYAQQIPVRHLPNGLYFVSFKGLWAKLLIQH